MDEINDPFNCPTCGAHDFGLYAVALCGCPHCMRAQLEAAHKAVWAMAEDGWLYFGPEGMSPTQQLVCDYTAKYPKSPHSAESEHGN